MFVVFCIVTIMFALIKFMPGDPTSVFFDSNYSQEMIQQQKKLWGLTDPIMVQYLRYLKNMATFDFGNSFFQIQPVRQIVFVKAAQYDHDDAPRPDPELYSGHLPGRGGRLEARVQVREHHHHDEPVSPLRTSLFRRHPGADDLLLQIEVAAFRRNDRARKCDGILATPSFPLDFLQHLILPTLVLTSREITGPTMLLRTSMLEVKGSEFLDILRAKGLPEFHIIRHATRNALIPLVTYIAVMTGLTFQGQVLLEIVFAWPGIGREIVTALNDLDYPVAQASFYLMALAILMMNFIADLVYGFIDPRVTYD